MVDFLINVSTCLLYSLCVYSFGDIIYLSFSLFSNTQKYTKIYHHSEDMETV